MEPLLKSGAHCKSKTSCHNEDPFASECICDWLRDTTNLDCGDRRRKLMHRPIGVSAGIVSIGWMP